MEIAPKYNPSIVEDKWYERWVRHFDAEKLTDYNRITIGSKEEMQTLIETLEKMLCEK